MWNGKVRIGINTYCNKHNINIEHMETDKDHIHYMIEYEPTISISKITNLMK